MVGGATRSEVRLVLILHKKNTNSQSGWHIIKYLSFHTPNESVAHGAQAYNENEA